MELLSTNHHIQHNNWSMSDLHSHPHYEIYFLYEGERLFFLEDALYKLFAPCLVAIPPYVLHKTEGGAFKRMNIDVLPEYLNVYQSAVLKRVGAKILLPKEEEEKALLRDMLALHDVSEEANYSKDIKSALFSYIIYNISRLEELDKALMPLNRKSLPPTLLDIIDYLNKSFRNDISLCSLSKKFFVSKAWVIYNFKRYLGVTPIDYLLTLRLNRAKTELLTTEKSILEISSGCGFSSPNYFSLIFKQKEGLSPTSFRKNKKEGN
jgi:AraC-like DNA-binding protein